MLTEEILNAESPSYLESAAERHGSVYRKERVKVILVLLVISTVTAGFCALLGMAHDHALGGALIGFLIVVPFILYYLYQLIVGLPHAETTPEATVRRYLQYCILPGSQMDSDQVGIEGYIYLLSVAQQEIGDLDALTKYWQEMNRNIRKELGDKLDYHAGKLLATDMVEKIHVRCRGEKIADCSVALRVEVGWTNGKLATEGLK